MSKTTVLWWFFACLTESRHSSGSSDHHFGPRGGDWLLQALHVSWNLNHDQEAPKIQTWGLLLPGPSCLWDLDVHRICLHRCECGAVPRQPLQPLWVAYRGVWRWADPDQRVNQWVWHIQQPVVLPRSLYETRLWYITEVGDTFQTT